MIQKTLQEWADFTGTLIACFNNGTNYSWRGIDPTYRPYVYIWSQYSEETKEIVVPTEFYKEFKWSMTRDLERDKYNMVFIPDDEGKVLYLEGSSLEKKYITGKLADAHQFFEIPIVAPQWSKDIYIPSNLQ